MKRPLLGLALVLLLAGCGGGSSKTTAAATTPPTKPSPTAVKPTPTKAAPKPAITAKAPAPVTTKPAPKPVVTKAPVPAPVKTAAPKPVPPGAREFANCTDMHNTYPGGVAEPGYVNKGGTLKHTPTVSQALYDANIKSDRDHDGIACES
jgi:outer membrane biosynthesis protein TonB